MLLPRAIATLVLLSAAAHAQAVADLPTPMGTERAAFLPAPGGRATVVLLAGGEGIVQFDSAGNTGNQNFLIRTRTMWAAYGINAIILSSPDNSSLMGQRSTAGYAQALAATVDFRPLARKRPGLACRHEPGLDRGGQRRGPSRQQGGRGGADLLGDPRQPIRRDRGERRSRRDCRADAGRRE